MGGSRSAKKAAKLSSQVQLRSCTSPRKRPPACVASQAASGRKLRGLGRRALAFQGYDNGLAPTLAG
jgi:hypothetical protein